MRDLHAVGSPMSANGAAASALADDDLGALEQPGGGLDARALDQAIIRARVDSRVANVALMMLHATERLDPLLQRLTRISLRWAVLGCSAWFTYYALSHAALGWERLAILATFMILGSLIWWKGQN